MEDAGTEEVLRRPASTTDKNGIRRNLLSYSKRFAGNVRVMTKATPGLFCGSAHRLRDVTASLFDKMNWLVMAGSNWEVCVYYPVFGDGRHDGLCNWDQYPFVISRSMLVKRPNHDDLGRVPEVKWVNKKWVWCFDTDLPSRSAS